MLSIHMYVKFILLYAIIIQAVFYFNQIMQRFQYTHVKSGKNRYFHKMLWPSLPHLSKRLKVQCVSY